MNRSADLHIVALAMLGLLTAACAFEGPDERAAEQAPTRQSPSEGTPESDGPDDPSHRTEDIDGVTHHFNKPPRPAGGDDYAAARPDAPSSVAYQGTVAVVGTAAAPEDGDAPSTAELQLGWLATDNLGCAWYVDLAGRKHPLIALEGSRVVKGGITFKGEFGDVHAKPGDAIAGDGRFVDNVEITVDGAPCSVSSGSGFLAMPYPN